MIAWGRMLYNALSGFHSSPETGLVRMFRTEYAKDYHWLKKQGCDINDKFVRTFLEMRTKS